MSTIGFVGLGHMGNPMASNLLKNWHAVIVYDLSSTAMLPLVQQGATGANQLTDIAQKADIIFTMLQTGEQVKKVCTGKAGLFSAAKPGTLFIDCSSIDVVTTRELHQEAKQAGFAMLDAPVSGGTAGAQAGTLTFMVGGEKKDFLRAEPILKNMGKNVIHAGSSGSGQAAKICNNMLLGISMLGVCEAFNLAEKLGLSADKLFEICSHSSGQCWSLTNYAPVPNVVPSSPANHDYQPGFTTDMMLKDLNLSQEAAKYVHANTPLGKQAQQLYESFQQQGNGQLDFSAIIKSLV